MDGSCGLPSEGLPCLPIPDGTPHRRYAPTHTISTLDIQRAGPLRGLVRGSRHCHGKLRSNQCTIPAGLHPRSCWLSRWPLKRSLMPAPFAHASHARQRHRPRLRTDPKGRRSSWQYRTLGKTALTPVACGRPQHTHRQSLPIPWADPWQLRWCRQSRVLWRDAPLPDSFALSGHACQQSRPIP